MSSATLCVDEATGVKLAYLDSGTPDASQNYTTIFAVHGMIWFFTKFMENAATKGVRVVAVQRRPFPGSTPLNPEELNTVLTGGTETDRATYVQARGHELAIFIDRFITKFSLPVDGGSILLGWSCSPPSSSRQYTDASRTNQKPTWCTYPFVCHLSNPESAPICFGLPMPSQNYSPLVVESIPPNKRLQAFAQWATGYFDHDASGNKFTLQTPHDPDTLEWVLHSSKIPTYYNIPTEELTQMTVYGDEASTDLPMLFFFQNEHKKALTAVLKDPDVASTFPNLKRAYITGDKAPAFGIAGMWAIQDEPGLMDAPIHFELVKGGNHFAMWDDPNMILNAVLRAAT